MWYTRIRLTLELNKIKIKSKDRVDNAIYSALYLCDDRVDCVMGETRRVEREKNIRKRVHSGTVKNALTGIAMVYANIS